MPMAQFGMFGVVLMLATLLGLLAITDGAKPGFKDRTTEPVLNHDSYHTLGCVTVGVISVAAAPFVLPWIGFTAAGITAGSTAASLMSAAATVGGGGVASMASGGVIAACQSIGAAGIGVKSAAIVAGVSSSAYTAASTMYGKTERNGNR